MEKNIEEIKQWFRDVWNFEPLDEDVELYKTEEFREHYNVQEELSKRRGGFKSNWREILDKRK